MGGGSPVSRTGLTRESEKAIFTVVSGIPGVLNRSGFGQCGHSLICLLGTLRGTQGFSVG